MSPGLRFYEWKMECLRHWSISLEALKRKLLKHQHLLEKCEGITLISFYSYNLFALWNSRFRFIYLLRNIWSSFKATESRFNKLPKNATGNLFNLMRLNKVKEWWSLLIQIISTVYHAFKYAKKKLYLYPWLSSNVLTSGSFCAPV